MLRRSVALFFIVLFGGIFAAISQSVAAQPLREVPANSATADVMTVEAATLNANNTATAIAAASATSVANANNTAFAVATSAANSNNTATAYAATLSVFMPIKVVINEIAWMGTKSNSGAEWIELFNPNDSDKPIDMNGWKIFSVTSSFTVTITGSIPAHGYYLLERNDTNTTDVTEDQVYNGDALSDTGEYLKLIDQNGFLIDSANRAGGSWPAGNGNKLIACSMERAGYNYPDDPRYWITNAGILINGKDASKTKTICGTPKSINWAYYVTATPTRTITPTPTSTPLPLSKVPTLTPRHSRTPTRNPYATPPSIVVINEFLSQPRSDWNNDGKIDSGDQFIEIINIGIKAVDLSGWTLDDQPGDSLPYTIKDVSLEPKARLAFFTSETGILLGTSGDTVRLISVTGQIWDAFTYGLIRTPDQSWCRLPDGFGLWKFGCGPTPKETNRLASSIILGNRVVSALCLSDNLPPEVRLAECDASGSSTWGSDLWNDDAEYFRFIDQGPDSFILD